MYWPKFQGLQIITVQTVRGQSNVVDEMVHYGIDLDDASFILENGHDCNRNKRRYGIVERCYDKGKKTIKIVVQRGYIVINESECWELIHVGMFTRRK